MAQELLTVDDLQRMLTVPRSTIYAWRYKGVGPPARHVGRHLRWTLGDVEAWLEQQRDDRR